MKHKSQIEHYTLEELATQVGDLRYDSLAEFLKLLSEKIKSDGEKDGARGRRQLAASLHSCAEELGDAVADIERAWVICKPYMSDYEN